MILIILGSIGQWLACCSLIGGITIEIVYRADIGYICITGGSLLAYIFTKIKLTGYEINEYKHKKGGRFTRGND